MSVKYDTIKDVGFQKIYDGYGTLNPDDFRKLCLEVVDKSRSKSLKKQEFKETLTRLHSKDRMLMLINSFALSGEGLKVI